MAGMYTRDKIENWVSDFCTGDAIRPFTGAVKEVAGEVLVTFLENACARRDVEPEDVEEADAKEALLGKLSRLNLPGAVRAEVPNLCGTFLAWLEAEGRLGGGRATGAFVRALTPAFLESADAARGKMKPIVNAGSKIGRNDPCPCGSGKKYKKCCG